MKTRIIIASVLISILAFYGLMSNPMTARLFIGEIVLTDTLSGTARFNNNLNVQGGALNLEGTSPTFNLGESTTDISMGYSTVTKDLSINSNPSTGNKIVIDFPNNANGVLEIKINGSLIASFNTPYTVFYNQLVCPSSQGLVLNGLTTDSLRIFDASDSLTVSNALGYIAVKVNGSTRYIPLYTTK